MTAGQKMSVAMRFIDASGRGLSPIPSNATGDLHIAVSGPSYSNDMHARYETGSAVFEGLSVDGTYAVDIRATLHFPTDARYASYYGKNQKFLADADDTSEIFVDLYELYASKISFTAVPASSALSGTVLPAFSVGVYDQFGSLLPTATGMVTVNFVNSTGTVVGQSFQKAVSNGVAAFADVTVPSEGGSFKLTATYQGLSSITHDISVTVLTASNLSVSASIPSSLTGGDAFPVVTVNVLDQFGAKLSTYQGQITLLLVDASTDAQISGVEPISATASAGTAVFSGYYTPDVSATAKIKVTATGMLPAYGQSFTINKKFVATASTLAWITSPPSSIVVGQTPSPVVVEVRDQNGAAITTTGTCVLEFVSSTGEVVATTGAAISDSRANWSAYNVPSVPGEYSVRVKLSGTTIVTTSIDRVVVSLPAPSVSKLAWPVQPATHIIIGAPTALVVEVQDAQGVHISTLNSGAINLKLKSSSGAVVIDTTENVVNGRTFFGAIVIAQSVVPGTYTFYASYPGVPDITHQVEITPLKGALLGMNVLLTDQNELYYYADTPFLKWSVPFVGGVRSLSAVHPKNTVRDRVFVLERNNKLSAISNLGADIPSIVTPYDLSGSLPASSYSIIAFAPSRDGRYLYLAVKSLSTGLQNLLRWDISDSASAQNISVFTRLSSVTADVTGLLEYVDGKVYVTAGKKIAAVSFLNLVNNEGTTESTFNTVSDVDGMCFVPGTNNVLAAEVNGSVVYRLSGLYIDQLSAPVAGAASASTYRSHVVCVDHPSYGPKIYLTRSDRFDLQSYILSNNSVSAVGPSAGYYYDYPDGTLMSQIVQPQLLPSSIVSGIFAPAADKLVVADGGSSGFIRIISLLDYTMLDFSLRNRSNSRLSNINGIVVY